MWVVVLVGLLVLGAAGAVFVPSASLVGWIALVATVLVGIVGLLVLFWLFRQLIRLSIGTAISPAGDPLGKLIAITFAAIAVTSIPLFVWNAGIRILINLFGRNPGYQSLSQLARTNCEPNRASCIVSAIDNAFSTLLRYFQSLLADLSLPLFPLVDLFWFIVAAALAALVVALFRSAVSRSADQPPLDVLRHMIPESVRRRFPVAILLIVAFYLGLSAMFAIPVLRSGADIGLTSAAVSEDRLKPPSEMIDRLNTLDIGITPIEFAAEPARADSGTAATPEASRLAGTPIGSDRMRIARTYAGIYDRQRDEFKRVLNGASSRLRQLTVETRALASSSPRAFLGKRDKDRFVAAVIDHYQTTISNYEIGLYNCRKALIEFREGIEQYRSGRQEVSLTVRLINLTGSGASDIDKAATEAIRTCQNANNPDQISPKLPPDPFELLGPFGATVRWLVTTDSRAISIIVGMIGFGLLGATLSRMIRKSEKEEGQLAGLESFFVVAGGVTAALVVFLGSYAMLGDQTSEPNAYIVFVTSLVGAVFSEDIWVWARERFTPNKEKEAKAQEAKAQEAKAQEAKAQEAKAQEAKAQDGKTEAVKVSPPGEDQSVPGENSIVPAAAENTVAAEAAPAPAEAPVGTADARSTDWSRYQPEKKG